MTYAQGKYPELAGKVAVITGAGRREGLGEAMARRLAAEGVKVVLTDIGHAAGEHMPEQAVGTSAEMEEIAAEIRAAGGDVATCVCNVLEPQEVHAAAEFALGHFGSLDIWINNAGIGYLMAPIVDMAADKWDAVLGVNLRGAFLGIKYAAEIMLRQGRGGRIINIGSQASKSGFAHAAAYTASKHGMVGLTRSAAQELGPAGITVNTLCPNHVTTGLGAWQNTHFSEVTGKGYERYMDDMRARIPLGRPGLQEDVAKACAFLCSDEASYITGEAMNVSGGEEYH
ncbi:SDR family NAD(P)-dependent oxidoreductase [Microbulbifer hydrolyticus]|uniref:Meso-butanediol dehydrogenase/(S,S)-butanediol dehydrogenase/diacetyl reductase n=1 Tax=Microbulbifer hydrolyticus TaxID=48074 RepID=A0A6P1TCL8_9GAMM|nr:SDR family NAD(P)-dependent oxidoreductase [Microbulbifer hydrolyticus]MBB5210176.1 meso-butanediol dehydrogenase/(S,S)-butanediol dehydrogenase/diacetyl reductase [Microbulbifer hydrolyticus]QHQ39310.1 SDR family oxidoreductase [Microbulbifer hydrolyticus]